MRIFLSQHSIKTDTEIFGGTTASRCSNRTSNVQATLKSTNTSSFSFHNFSTSSSQTFLVIISLALGEHSKFVTRISQEWIQRCGRWRIVRSPRNNGLSGWTEHGTATASSEIVESVHSQLVSDLHCDGSWETAARQGSLIWLYDCTKKNTSLIDLSRIQQWIRNIWGF